MTKILKIEIKLIRERFKIFGIFNILSLSAVLLAIFVGIKALINLFPNYYGIANLLTMILVIVEATQVQPRIISSNEIKMLTFFPEVNYNNIKKYYLYKKYFLVLFAIIYLLVPLNFNAHNIKIFIGFFSILSILMLINTIGTRLSLNGTGKDSINNIIRFVYPWFVVINERQKIIDIERYLVSFDIWCLVLLLVITLFFNFILIKRPDRKEMLND